jgi:hypothetical protein
VDISLSLSVTAVMDIQVVFKCYHVATCDE